MIRKLLLKNFRNYSEFDISFNRQISVFTGKNGQGKTNILEAVYFVSILRSFRTSQVRDLKKIGSNGFYISSEIDGLSNWLKRLEIEYSYNKRLKIDGSNILRTSDFIRQIKTVIFSPDDINIVTGNSGLRRRFIDILISMQVPEYMGCLSDYSSALSSRNAYLRAGEKNLDVMKAFEKILADNMAKIIEYRSDFLEKLSVKVNELLFEFFGTNFTFEIKYRPEFIARSVEEYMKNFEKERKKDIQRGFTGFGPHLDEMDLIYNSKLLRNFGSTGQCRLISLCLNMAKINILSEKSARNLIVLVDDVTGELDASTKKTFKKVINKAEQIFFTFTEIPSEDYFKEAEVFNIENGKIIS